MDIFKVLGWKKGRKYPIKRDGEGRSIRERCFEQFEQGKRPGAVAEELGTKAATACRYFRDWQRLGPNFEKKYAFAKELFKKTAPDREKNIELYSGLLGIEKEQLETILSQPHGLKQLMTGKLYFPAQALDDHKRHMALKLALLFSEHLIKRGGNLEDVYLAIRHWIKKYQQYREETDEDIKEDNKAILFMRSVIHADLENEWRGRVQPDWLSKQEIDTIIKWPLQSVAKQIETMYWGKIERARSQGLNEEQAREKIYQDLLKNGDVEKAKLMRAYQDKVHPLKSENQQPSPEPPTSTQNLPG